MGIIENSRRRQYAVLENNDKDTSDRKVKKNTLAKTWQSIYKDIFTFKPKVSPQSSKIVKTLGTDFMSRQKLHIEKQQRNLQQAILSQGSSSPVKQNYKYSTQGHANMTDIHLEERCGSEGDANHNGLTDALPDSITELCIPHPPENTNPKCTSVPPDSSTEQEATEENNVQWNAPSMPQKPNRSKTIVSTNWAGKRPSLLWKSPTQIQALNVHLAANQEKVKEAKVSAEKAIKNKKIFTIQGPYPAIRESLRNRGWVEKFYKLHMSPPKKSPRVKKLKNSNEDEDDNGDDDDDDDDDGDDQNDDEDGKIPPWDEENGIYGIMSRVVRNSPPTFIWCVRRDAVDVKALKKDQYINHYGKATFTTKVGLCINLRNTMWFEPENPDSFFPRCYRLSHDEEKEAFVDDYKMTVCTSVLKWVRDHSADFPATEEELNSKKGNNSPRKENSLQNKTTPERVIKKKKKGAPVPMKLLEVALEQCRRYIRFQDHDDLDDPSETELLVTANWDQMFQWYYTLVYDEGVIVGAQSKLGEINSCLDHLKPILPQLDLDGYQNVWIVKPGAKSRGRGITLYNRLDEMLKLVNSSVLKKDSKFVVQKYIERPLLVHKTKFDIRQWFLVTDWNPLTIYFYKDCYLRFCSQQYTLDMLDESIHLSNNSIQKYYSNGNRSADLPDDNMWSSDQFKSYLITHGKEHKWDELVYPNMKEAVICSILATQDIVEYRKSAFELYGADFMLTEDLKPWLIEINSSPCMAYSTKVTAQLCAAVLEDTVKVVLDRKADKNADIGRFELAYKQTQVTVPPYIGINLSVEGQTIKKPSWSSLKKDDSSPTRHSIHVSHKESPTHKSSMNKKESIDLSMNTNGKSQNKSNLNSGGGKKSPAHNSKSHVTQNKPVTKSVTMAYAPATTVGPFSPCPPSTKKRPKAPLLVPQPSDQEIESNDSSSEETTPKTTTEEAIEEASKLEINGDNTKDLNKDSADKSRKESPKESRENSAKELTSVKESSKEQRKSSAKDLGKSPVKESTNESVNKSIKENLKGVTEETVKEETYSLQPQKIVTFPVMTVPYRSRSQTDPTKVTKSMPDYVDQSRTLHGTDPGMVEGTWAVEENNNYVFNPEAFHETENGFTTKDYLMRSAVIETIHHSVLKNSVGFKRHWQIHRGGGYNRRSSMKKTTTGQPQSTPMVDDPNFPVLLMHQSRLHSPQPGSSSNSRTSSPEPIVGQYRLQSRPTRSSSIDGHSYSSNPINYHSVALIANQTVHRSPMSPTLIKASPHKSLSTFSDNIKGAGILHTGSAPNQRHVNSTPTNSAFPGLVSRYIRRKSLRNSIDIAIDCYKTNPKLTVINPSFL